MCAVFFLRCSLTHPLAIVQMARKTSHIIVWEINSSIDFTFTHKMNFCLETDNVESDVKGAFDLEGSLFIAKSNSVWHVRQ